MGGGRLLAAAAAPLLPLAGVGVLLGMCALGGLLGRIPVAGEIFVGVTWGLGLVLGFLMVLVLMGVATAWPLMFATISYKNCPVVVLTLNAPSALLGFQLGGIVGHKFLSKYRVGIDLERSVLRLKNVS